MRTVGEQGRKRRGISGVGGILILLLLGVAVYICVQIWGFSEAASGDLMEPDSLREAPEVTFEIDGETVEALRIMSRKDKRYKPLAKHPEYYPEDLLRQVLRNDELLEFALDYPEMVTRDWDPDYVGMKEADGIPHLLQWDAHWGYGGYGSSVVGVSGCGPTCLSMVVVGLTGDLDVNPLAVAQYSEAQGWYIPGAGTDWELMRAGAAHYGLHWQELSPEADALRSVLDQGGCIIASMLPGDFTASGHFIVISGYDADGFQVLDPNSNKLSHSWDFAELKPQFAAIWGYTA